MADFVKFAKVRPLPDDNEASYQRAVNFVNETRPVIAEVESVQDKDSKTVDAQTPIAEGGQKNS